jgi:hypothetical protein
MTSAARHPMRAVLGLAATLYVGPLVLIVLLTPVALLLLR